MTTLSTAGPGRTVHHGDALSWLRAAGALVGASVVTSLPDASELPALGLDGCQRWFDEAAVLTYGRASYSHLLGFARVLRPTLRRATPDVLPDGGLQPGVKAMGVLACLDACRFVIAETTTRTRSGPPSLTALARIRTDPCYRHAPLTWSNAYLS